MTYPFSCGDFNNGLILFQGKFSWLLAGWPAIVAAISHADPGSRRPQQLTDSPDIEINTLPNHSKEVPQQQPTTIVEEREPIEVTFAVRSSTRRAKHSMYAMESIVIVVVNESCKINSHTLLHMPGSIHSSLPIGTIYESPLAQACLQKKVCTTNIKIHCDNVYRWQGIVTCLFASSHGLEGRTTAVMQPRRVVH